MAQLPVPFCEWAFHVPCPTISSRRSDFKASFEGILSAIKDLERAMTDINEIGDKYVQLLQQYFYRCVPRS